MLQSWDGSNFPSPLCFLPVCQISKWICSNWQMYLFKLPDVFVHRMLQSWNGRKHRGRISIFHRHCACSLHARIAMCSAEQQKQLQYLWLYPMHCYSVCIVSMQISNILFCSCAKCWRMWRCMVEYDDVLYRLAFGWPSSGTLFGPIALLIGLRPVIQFQHKYFWCSTQILLVSHTNTFGIPHITVFGLLF